MKNNEVEPVKMMSKHVVRVEPPLSLVNTNHTLALVNADPASRLAIACPGRKHGTTGCFMLFLDRELWNKV